MYKKCIVVLLAFCSVLLAACGASGSGELDFIFMSDTQAEPADEYTAADYQIYASLLAQGREQDPAASVLLLGGDLVNDGSDADEWAVFREAGGELFDGLTVLAAEGNHDRKALVYDEFPQPRGAELYKGSFWSWNSGGVHFLVLDSSLMGAAEPEDIAWVQQDLESNSEPWTVALMHHPAYTVSSKQKDEDRAQVIRDQFCPLLEQYGVDLVLCGHQHYYMRTKPQNGVTYVMLTSGPKEYTAGAEHDYIETAGECPAYMTAHVDGANLQANVYDEQGGLLDSFSLTAKEKGE